MRTRRSCSSPAANAGGDPGALDAEAFVATDPDTRADTTEDDADAVAEYDVEGADAKYFNITDDPDITDAGILTIVTAGANAHTPDYEKQSSYSITIVAIGGAGDRRLAGRLDVTIKVTNDEDAGVVELSQIGPQRGRAVVASLTDQDGGATISKWVWEYAPLETGEVCIPGAGGSGPDEGDWNAVPGATSASYTPNDFVSEGTTVPITGNCLRAAATYTDDFVVLDDDTTADEDESIDTAMQVTDAAVQASGASNAAPKFGDQDLVTPGDQSGATSREVAENTAAGQPIGMAVSANDSDTGDLSLYTLGGADMASFGIDRKTGQLKTKAALDYETKDTYVVTVTATDPSGASDVITVTINVTNENDGATITVGAVENTPPAFASSTLNRSVDENMPAGTAVGNPVTADDPGDGDVLD